MTFLWMISHRKKMVAYNFLPSFDNANGGLCHGKMGQNYFAAMVT